MAKTMSARTAAQDEEEEVLHLDAALVLFGGGLQETHRGPTHFADAEFVEQVDDHRQGKCGESGEGGRG